MNEASPSAVVCAPDISECVYTKLLVLRPILEQQGIVQRHGPSYRLRYRALDPDGIVRHHSVHLGDEQAALLTQVVLDRWRGEQQAAEDKQAAELKAERLAAQRHKLSRRLAQELAGGGPRHRRRIGRWFDSLGDEPAAAIRFAFAGEFPKPPRPGRPPRNRFW